MQQEQDNVAAIEDPQQADNMDLNSVATFFRVRVHVRNQLTLGNDVIRVRHAELPGGWTIPEALALLNPRSRNVLSLAAAAVMDLARTQGVLLNPRPTTLVTRTLMRASDDTLNPWAFFMDHPEQTQIRTVTTPQGIHQYIVVEIFVSAGPYFRGWPQGQLYEAYKVQYRSLYNTCRTTPVFSGITQPDGSLRFCAPIIEGLEFEDLQTTSATGSLANQHSARSRSPHPPLPKRSWNQVGLSGAEQPAAPVYGVPQVASLKTFTGWGKRFGSNGPTN